MTYPWANVIFEKKLVVEKTGVTKYNIKERLQLDHHHTKIPKMSVHVCFPLVVWIKYSRVLFTGRGSISKQTDRKPTAHSIFD